MRTMADGGAYLDFSKGTEVIDNGSDCKKAA